MVRDRHPMPGPPVERLPLPETVHAIIAARLDALPAEEKAALQDLSVLGRVGWVGALAAVSGRTRAEVEACLERLRAKEFLYRAGRSSMAGEREYGFRHVLVCEVAYGQIPRLERAGKHRRAADWLESAGRRALGAARPPLRPGPRAGQRRRPGHRRPGRPGPPGPARRRRPGHRARRPPHRRPLLLRGPGHLAGWRPRASRSRAAGRLRLLPGRGRRRGPAQQRPGRAAGHRRPRAGGRARVPPRPARLHPGPGPPRPPRPGAGPGRRPGPAPLQGGGARPLHHAPAGGRPERRRDAGRPRGPGHDPEPRRPQGRGGRPPHHRGHPGLPRRPGRRRATSERCIALCEADGSSRVISWHTTSPSRSPCSATCDAASASGRPPGRRPSTSGRPGRCAGWSWSGRLSTSGPAAGTRRSGPRLGARRTARRAPPALHGVPLPALAGPDPAGQGPLAGSREDASRALALARESGDHLRLDPALAFNTRGY